MQPDQHLVDTFQKLADFTAPKCVSCRSPFVCCTAQQCADTKAFAKDTFGIELVETGGILPFLGPSGCIVAPHLRPICSVHVCESHLDDSEWSEQYFELREEAGEALLDAVEQAGGEI